MNIIKAQRLKTNTLALLGITTSVVCSMIVGEMRMWVLLV